MARVALSLAIAAIGLSSIVSDVRAGDFAPLSWLFSTDNGGPLAPAITPDRPYWHGDSAVPPSMRWHDRQIEIVDEYGATVGTRAPLTEDPGPVPAEMALPSPSQAARRVVRRRHIRAKVAQVVCPPASVHSVGVAHSGVSEPPDPLSAPARAER